MTRLHRGLLLFALFALLLPTLAACAPAASPTAPAVPPTPPPTQGPLSGPGGALGPVTAVARYLRHMADLTASMLRDAVRSLDESNADMARQVSARDAELDSEFDAALRQILTLVMQDSRYLGATIDTVFALKGLERIGDHAKNIAEQVLFVTSGEDVRHQRKV